MKYLLTLLPCALLILLGSCKNSRVLITPKFTTTVFHGQRGTTEVNALNKKQAEREKRLAEEIEKSEIALQTLKDQKAMFYSIDSTERIKEIDVQLNQLMAKTEKIIQELNDTDPFSPQGHEKSLSLAMELNDLLYKYVIPLGELITANKEIKNISSDIGFETGSSVLNDDGKKMIKVMLDSIKRDIEGWRTYLDNHNENIFAEDDFSTILIISGYSDKQGSGDEDVRVERNQVLSEERAKVVAAEFEKQLAKMNVDWKLGFKISHEGKGEDLPPNVKDDSKKNNSNRRVTTIRMVVGPKVLLYNNGE